jgi:hypothetical protein
MRKMIPLTKVRGVQLRPPTAGSLFVFMSGRSPGLRGAYANKAFTCKNRLPMPLSAQWI